MATNFLHCLHCISLLKNSAGEVTKNTPVAGFIQVTNKKTIRHLKRFCSEELSVRNGGQQKELRLIQSQIPALWNILIEICQYDKSDFLPQQISTLILKLIEIRKKNF